MAVALGKTDVVTQLLAKGADPNLNYEGKTLVQIAEAKQYEHIAKILRKKIQNIRENGWLDDEASVDTTHAINLNNSHDMDVISPIIKKKTIPKANLVRFFGLP